MAVNRNFRKQHPIFEKYIGAVLDYDVFLTVDELNESSRELVEHYPDIVEYEEIGESRQGEPIPMLTIGDGSKSALLFGCPHPNEPIGAMMLEFLSWELAKNPELLDALDYTWYIIKVIDPDSTRLNEGWFKGPFTIRNYARNFYRPPSHQQVEWTFPVEYKTQKFDDPLPETEALMKAMKRAEPDFMFSLHNSGFGGVYYYLSEEAPDVYEVLHRLPEDQELPLSLGEPEMPWAEELAEVIYRMPTTAQTYDFLEEHGDQDPAEILTAGTSSDDYVRRFTDALTLICEMPYFFEERIVDTSPSDMSRREAVLAKVRAGQEQLEFMQEQWDRIEPYLERETPFTATVKTALETQEGRLAATEEWARTSEETDRPATVAEVFDNQQVAAFYRLLSTGVFRRLVEDELTYEIQHGASREEALEAFNEVNDRLKVRFNEKADELEESIDYEVIPIQKLVRVQFGCALYLADYVQTNREKQ